MRAIPGATSVRARPRPRPQPESMTRHPQLTPPLADDRRAFSYAASLPDDSHWPQTIL